MPDNLFGSFLQTLSPASVLLCTVMSLVMGFAVALVYMFRNTYSKNFAVTLALLPAMVQAVIMLVNGNLGTGVAVMGAFGLVRFRSAPGSAREIGAIFFAMAIGLATGMGYLAFALMFLGVIGGVMLILAATPFGEQRGGEKDLRITIPESLDYTGIFDDLFQNYATGAKLLRVKTTNMGSMYELQYHLTLRDETKEKEFLDAIRCRNGNLNIVCGRVASGREEVL